jgi:hypothetical protein
VRVCGFPDWVISVISDVLARSSLDNWGVMNRRKSEFVLFVIGGGVLYLTTQLVIVLTLGEPLPLLGWVGFLIVSTIVVAASTILAVFLVHSSLAAASQVPGERPIATPGVHCAVMRDGR